MDERDGLLWFIICIVFFFGGVATGMILFMLGDTNVSELAQSICDQEFNMDFDTYDDGTLKCKPKDVRAEVQYDGIVIQIK